MNRIVASFAVAIMLSIPVFFLFIPVESYLLENTYDVLSDIDQSEWLINFREVGIYCLLISLAFTFIWFIYSFLRYQVIYWGSAGGFGAWGLLLCVMLFVVFLFGYFMNYSVQDAGRYIAAFFYFLNSLFLYWLSSLLQSPATVKFAPLGAKQIRRLGFLRKLLN